MVFRPRWVIRPLPDAHQIRQPISPNMHQLNALARLRGPMNKLPPEAVVPQEREPMNLGVPALLAVAIATCPGDRRARDR
jgi:hypothetical protein